MQEKKTCVEFCAGIVRAKHAFAWEPPLNVEYDDVVRVTAQSKLQLNTLAVLGFRRSDTEHYYDNKAKLMYANTTENIP